MKKEKKEICFVTFDRIDKKKVDRKSSSCLIEKWFPNSVFRIPKQNYKGI